MKIRTVADSDLMPQTIFRRLRRIRLPFAALLVAAAGLACQNMFDSMEPDAEMPAEVVVSPKSVIILPDDSVRFVAVALTQSGDTADVDLVWSATDGSITVSNAPGDNRGQGGGGAKGKRVGWYKNGKCGNYQVSATSSPGGVSGSADVTVTCEEPGPVASVTVTPESATLGVGESVQLSVEMEDANGIRLTDPVVTWTSNSESVATVDGSGMVTGAGDGSTMVMATADGVSDGSSITVETQAPAPVASVEVIPGSATIQVGGTIQLSTVLRDADQNELSGRTVTWASNSEAVATVNGSGLVTGEGEGSTTITATSEGVSGTASITVSTTTGGGGGSTAPNLKVAFIADQGSGSDAIAVLQLIRDEGADMVLHQGDFDYENDPNLWESNVNSVLGENFPYFASVGNHDDNNFYGAGGYQEKLQQRVDRIADATCTGDLGVNSSCEYQGLFFVLSGVGTLGDGHETYIRDQLTADNSTWRVCSWHKNQEAMQVGGKSNSVGWEAYETCRELGAIIATGHEHSYSRTKTLTSTEFQTVDPDWSDPGALRVTAGATFVFVAGLGGASIRDQERCLPTTYPYGCNGEWASIYTSNQNAQHGALFIEFHVDGDPNKARGYFKDIDGQVVDQFTVTSQLNLSGLASARSETNAFTLTSYDYLGVSEGR